VTFMMLALIFLLPLCSSIQVEEAEISLWYRNPVLPRNSPDPGALALPDGSGYALVTTSNFALNSEGDPALPLYFSTDLVNWIPKGHVFPAGTWPDWAVENMWAPEIHFVNGTFLVYFTGGSVFLSLVHRVHVGVARSLSGSPWGPYTDPLGSPLVEEPLSLTGAIDPHYFRDPVSGEHFLLWRTDNMWSTDPEDRAIVYIRRLTDDGLAFHQESSAAVLLKGGWDGTGPEDWTAEAPWMVFRNGLYYLFFSTHAFDHAQYNVRVATSSSLHERFTKHPTPVVETDWERWGNGENSTFVGPGHPCVVGDWLVYHAWLYDHISADQEVPGRQLLLDRLLWTETRSTNGSVTQWPRVDGGRPSDTEQPGPETVPTIIVL